MQLQQFQQQERVRSQMSSSKRIQTADSNTSQRNLPKPLNQNLISLPTVSASTLANKPSSNHSSARPIATSYQHSRSSTAIPNHHRILSSQQLPPTQQLLSHSRSDFKFHKSKHILTVANTLKNPIIADTVQIDIGSLNEFLEPLTTTTKIVKQPLLLNQQRRAITSAKNEQAQARRNKIQSAENRDNSNDDNLEESHDRDTNEIKKYKFTTPIEVLKYEENEKRRQHAAKQIVSQIFKSHYGDEVEKIEEANAKHIAQLKSQDDSIALDPDSLLSRLIKKGKQRTLKDKIKILDDHLNDPFPLQQQPTLGLPTKSALLHHTTSQVSFAPILNINNQTSAITSSPGQSMMPIRRGILSNQPEDDLRPQLIMAMSSREDTSTTRMNEFQSADSLKKCFESPENIISYRRDRLFDLKSRQQDIYDAWLTYGGQNDATIKTNEQLYTQFVLETFVKPFQISNKKYYRFLHWQMRFRQRITFTDPDYDEFQREYTELPQDELNLIDQTRFVLWNKPIDTTFLIYLTINYAHFHSLQTIELFNNQLSETGMIVLLESLVNESRELQKLNISHNYIGNRASLLINKLFCSLCLTIAQLQTIQELDVGGNHLDDRAIDSIKSIARYVKSIRRIQVTNNLFSESRAKEVKKTLANTVKNKEVLF